MYKVRSLHTPVKQSKGPWPWMHLTPCALCLRWCQAKQGSPSSQVSPLQPSSLSWHDSKILTTWFQFRLTDFRMSVSWFVRVGASATLTFLEAKWWPSSDHHHKSMLAYTYMVIQPEIITKLTLPASAGSFELRSNWVCFWWRVAVSKVHPSQQPVNSDNTHVFGNWPWYLTTHV